MKACTRCGETKELSEFHRMQASPDGHRPECKECRRGTSADHYRTNAEAIKGRVREYSTRPELATKIKEEKREWQIRNRETITAKELERYHSDPTQNKARKKRYHSTEKGRANIRKQSMLRRVRRNNVDCTLTDQEWSEVIYQFDWKCAYCGCDLTFDNITMDHVVPLSAGGPHSVDNVVPACRSCNCSKGAKIL